MKPILRLRRFFQRNRLDAEMREEMGIHLDLQAERNRAAGMGAEDARFAAERQFGNVASLRERVREQRGWLWLEQGRQDVRYAFRGLARNPGFTVVTVATLALGIGASTVLFSVVNAVFLRRLPVEQPAALYLLSVDAPEMWRRPFSQTYVRYFQEHAGTARDLAATGVWAGFREFSVRGTEDGKRDELMTFEVGGNYFEVMGVRPAAGRLFGPADDTPSSSPAAVISHELWARRFGRDPSVIGREIQLDRFPVTIVGVAAPGFFGALVGARADLWLPVELGPRIDQNQPWGAGGLKGNYPLFNLVARLAPDVSPAQAEKELTVLFRQQLAAGTGLPSWQRRATPPEVAQAQIRLQSLATGYGGVRQWLERPIALLAVMVGVVLLVTCANIAGLLLVRGSTREREFAMRSALGASRGRIMRQLLAESFALALLGGVAGAVVAEWGIRGVGDFLEVIDLAPDGRVLGFSAGITALVGLGVGLLPARRLGRHRQDAATAMQPRLSQLLVISQIGLAFVLCSAATLVVQTFRNVSRIDAGIQPQHLFVAPLVVPRDAAPARRFAIEQALREACLDLPGVRQVSFAQGLPLIGGTRIKAESAHEIRESPAGTIKLSANRVTAGPDFFATLGIPLLHGRGFEAADSASDAPARVILGARAAHALFGERNPVGLRISLWKDFEVIGVAADIKVASLREETRAIVYLPRQALPSTLSTTLLIRTDADGRLVLDDVRALLRRIDAQAAVSALAPVDGIFSREVRTEKLLAQLAACFAIFVLLLACLGLFGLLAFNVTRRTREIGVRLALGASHRGLIRMVLREGMQLVLGGTVLGLGGAAGSAHLAASLLYGISPTEPWVYGTMTAVLAVAALGACWLPAHRAARVDPMVALRSE